MPHAHIVKHTESHTLSHTRTHTRAPYIDTSASVSERIEFDPKKLEKIQTNQRCVRVESHHITERSISWCVVFTM